MTALTDRFSTARMLAEYDEHYYAPAREYAARLGGPSPRTVRRLSTWLERLDVAWFNVRVAQLRADDSSVAVGAPLRVEALVELGDLKPSEVAADLLIGPLDEAGELRDPSIVPLKPERGARDGRFCYRSEPLHLEMSGTIGLLIRLTPHHPDLLPSQALSRARWGP
jgi:hypothetical protein